MGYSGYDKEEVKNGIFIALVAVILISLFSVLAYNEYCFRKTHTKGIEQVNVTVTNKEFVESWTEITYFIDSQGNRTRRRRHHPARYLITFSYFEFQEEWDSQSVYNRVSIGDKYEAVVEMWVHNQTKKVDRLSFLRINTN